MVVQKSKAACGHGVCPVLAGLRSINSPRSTSIVEIPPMTLSKLQLISSRSGTQIYIFEIRSLVKLGMTIIIGYRFATGPHPHHHISLPFTLNRPKCRLNDKVTQNGNCGPLVPNTLESSQTSGEASPPFPQILSLTSEAKPSACHILTRPSPPSLSGT